MTGDSAKLLREESTESIETGPPQTSYTSTWCISPVNSLEEFIDSRNDLPMTLAKVVALTEQSSIIVTAAFIEMVVTGVMVGDVVGLFDGARVVGDMLGDEVGDLLGPVEGDMLGDKVGDALGNLLGPLDGAIVDGDMLGCEVGSLLGDELGDSFGDLLGLRKEVPEGEEFGAADGLLDEEADGEKLGVLNGFLDGDFVGGMLGAFEVGDNELGDDEVGATEIGLPDGPDEIEGELLIVGEGVVNRNRSAASVKWSSGKFGLFGHTLSSFSSETPTHSANGRNTASQLVVGIIRPLPRLNSPSSVKFPG